MRRADQAYEQLRRANPVPEPFLLLEEATQIALGTREPSETSTTYQELARRRKPSGWVIGVAAAAVILAVGLLGVIARQPVESSAGSQGPPATAGPNVDFIIDLNTSETAPVPESIRRLVTPDRPSESVFSAVRYAASWDGSQLAFVGRGDDGSLQIYVGGFDGTDVRQVTHHPAGAISPAWSPDGTMIAYQGDEGLFVVDLATGESEHVASAPAGAAGPQFTDDGAALMYTYSTTPANPGTNQALWIAPIDGGESTMLVGRAQRMEQAGGGSLSPDGSLVTMLGSKIGGPGALRFIARTDGSEPEEMVLLHSGNCVSYPAGTWSPDGRRMVCWGSGGVLVVDVESTKVTLVAEGNGAIWLDDHMLLVESIPNPEWEPTSSGDYVLDISTGDTALLPLDIRSQSPSAYSPSPDGSMVAYVAPSADEGPQVFIADIDGTNIHQITQVPGLPGSPAWSPDGSTVAYVESGGVFVLELATGESTHIDVDGSDLADIQFTPDGSSILYGIHGKVGIWTVPIDGGISTLLIGRDHGVETWGGSMSPDGSMVTFNGNRIGGPGAIRFLADSDGSNVRELARLDGGNCGWSGSSGIWSPDGTRIVCAGSSGVLVTDVATGEISSVGVGKAAIWLDEHTLLIEA